MLDNELKQLYKSAMDKEKPSAESLLRLKNTIEEGAVNPPKPTYGFRRHLPLAASFILLAVLTLPLMNLIQQNKPKEITNPSAAMQTPSGSSEVKIFERSLPPPTTPIPSVFTVNEGPSESGDTEIAALGGGVIAESEYEELFTVINELHLKRSAESWMYVTNGATAEKAVSAPVSAPQTYSDTNIQVAGVQEADIVKTDGQYIYSYSSDKLNIIRAENGSLTKMSFLSRSQENEDGNQSGNAFEMYVEGNKLIVLRNSYIYRIMRNSPAAPESKIYPPPNNTKPFVAADIYDISDKKNPKLLNSFSQDGNYVSSRMIGGVIYLVSTSYIPGEIMLEDPASFVPQVYRNGEASLIAAKDISIGIDPQKSSGTAQYLLLTGIDTGEEGVLVSNKSVLGYGNQIYASKDNLYVSSYSRLEEEGTVYGATKLYRFALDSGNISLEAEGSVPGAILNQFSMDEYKNVFRIVTTVNSFTYINPNTPSSKHSSGVIEQNEQYNCLYTLDSNLAIIGKIEKLALDERVYSVRFDGDIGYFVTFRQVDPLFAVDLSNPSNPRVLSALKIPGFSQYLHPYSDTLLFGLGRDADEQSGRAGFIKLSMFDVSDPKNVSEKSKLILEGINYSEASYNHKAIIVDGAKNIIAFPAEGKYLIYSYSPSGGFKQEASLTSSGEKYAYNSRGLYIGDYFYVVSEKGINAYSMRDYKSINEITF